MSIKNVSLGTVLLIISMISPSYSNQLPNQMLSGDLSVSQVSILIQKGLSSPETSQVPTPLSQGRQFNVRHAFQIQISEILGDDTERGEGNLKTIVAGDTVEIPSEVNLMVSDQRISANGNKEFLLSLEPTSIIDSEIEEMEEVGNDLPLNFWVNASDLRIENLQELNIEKLSALEQSDSPDMVIWVQDQYASLKRKVRIKKMTYCAREVKAELYKFGVCKVPNPGGGKATEMYSILQKSNCGMTPARYNDNLPIGSVCVSGKGRYTIRCGDVVTVKGHKVLRAGYCGHVAVKIAPKLWKGAGLKPTPWLNGRTPMGCLVPQKKAKSKFATQGPKRKPSSLASGSVIGSQRSVAATLSKKIMRADQGTYDMVFFQSDINLRSVRKLSLILNGKSIQKPTAVLINSAGGDPDQTLRLRKKLISFADEHLKATGKKLVVAVLDQCNSACPLLLTGLNHFSSKNNMQIIISKQAQLGFHQPRQLINGRASLIKNKLERTNEIENESTRFLNAGLNPNWELKNRQLFASVKTRFVTAEQLVNEQSGIISEDSLVDSQLDLFQAISDLLD